MIANIKALYRQHVLEWLEMTINRSISDSSGQPSPPADLKVSLLNGAYFIYGAWYEVKQCTFRTVQNCRPFARKGAFVPVIS